MNDYMYYLDVLASILVSVHGLPTVRYVLRVHLLSVVLLLVVLLQLPVELSSDFGFIGQAWEVRIYGHC